MDIKLRLNQFSLKSKGNFQDKIMAKVPPPLQSTFRFNLMAQVKLSDFLSELREAKRPGCFGHPVLLLLLLLGRVDNKTRREAGSVDASTTEWGEKWRGEPRPETPDKTLIRFRKAHTSHGRWNRSRTTPSWGIIMKSCRRKLKGDKQGKFVELVAWQRCSLKS